jgi:hypothetical protein
VRFRKKGLHSSKHSWSDDREEIRLFIEIGICFSTVNRTRLVRLAGKLQRDAKIMLGNAKTEVTWNGACIESEALIEKQ